MSVVQKWIYPNEDWRWNQRELTSEHNAVVEDRARLTSLLADLQQEINDRAAWEEKMREALENAWVDCETCEGRGWNSAPTCCEMPTASGECCANPVEGREECNDCSGGGRFPALAPADTKGE